MIYILSKLNIDFMTCISLLDFPSTSFFRYLQSDSSFKTRCLDRSHFKMAQDKLLVFGSLLINTNSCKTANSEHDSLNGAMKS
jgi:hypothetical protein